MLPLEKARIGASIVAGYLGAALPYVAIIAAIVMLAAARGRPLLALARALRGATLRNQRATLLAGVAGMGTIGAAALAIEAAGPGAVVWIWVAALVGAVFAWTEVHLAINATDEPAQRSPWTTMRAGLGRSGGALAWVHALALLIAAAYVGVLFQAEQAAEFARTLSAVPRLTAIAVVGVTAAAIAFVPPVRRQLVVIAPVGLGLIMLAGLVVLALDLEGTSAAVTAIFEHAFGSKAAEGVAAAGLLVTLQVVLVRATYASEAGLGTLALSTEDVEDAASLPGRAAWIPAITVAVVGTITGLVVLVTGASNHELAGEKLFLPLTHLERTGAVPSEHGQAFVLPEDTRLEENHAYDMVMLANPRGHKLGKIIAGDNTVLLPVWGITEGASTVYLRHNDPAKAHPSFDLEIPCTAKTIERGGIKWLELRPVDPETDLAKLARVRNLDGPYVRLGDFPLRGLVMRSLGTRAGSEPVEHLSMVEGARDPDAPDNPTLRTIVTLGFAGPYVAGDEAPWAIVGAEGYAPELGALVHLRLSSPARGLELGYLNDYDKLSLPPWEFLAGAQTVILRHKEDPARDLRVPVQHEVKAGRLQFSSAVEGFAFKDLAKLESYEDRPYLLAPPYRFTAEVHGDTRLPAQFAGRRALIPSESYRDLSLRPEGLYRANPRDVLQSDMVGPVVDHDGAGVVASALARRLPRPVNLLLGVTGLVLAAGTIACWTRHGARAGAELLVNRSWLRIGVSLLLLGLLVVAVDLPLERLLGPADTAITAVLVLHALILVLLTPQLARQASK